MQTQNLQQQVTTSAGTPAFTPRFTVDQAAVQQAIDVLEHTRVAIFVIAYNAERFIDSVIQRIPAELRDRFAEIYVIDDSSSDRTFEVASATSDRLGLSNLTVLKTPFNRGYGGNQKLGYLHAIKRGYDYVVLLHGDGQYAPEFLPQIVGVLGEGQTDALIGSRMIHRASALSGGMPIYKWIGNQLLTSLENRLLGSNLSEFHSGYRAYSVPTLEAIPFELNSNDFHFDTDILVQLLLTGRRIREIPVPTYYGEEICHVNGVKYAVNCLKSVTKPKLMQLGLYYEPKFDLGLFEAEGYRLKTAANSLHQFILSREWSQDAQVADLGANHGLLSAELAAKVRSVTSVDVEAPDQAGAAEPLAVDLDGEFETILGHERFDAVLALDVIEHLKRPEQAARRLAAILRPGGTLYASTGNVAFLPMRLSLLLGQFNYGKRGILDQTHTRLFTVYSFTKLLVDSGFVIKELRGFGPPIRDMIGASKGLTALDNSLFRLARAWPRMFAFNFLLVAQRTDAIEDIYERTAASRLRRVHAGDDLTAR